MLDAFVASEGEAEVVMFSGGEPTVHKHILDFIDAAQARPIKSVTLNTNGIRLASDRAIVDALGERNRVPGRSVNIYLQFDGFDKRTHRLIRGRDLRDIKQKALDNCAGAGLTVTLRGLGHRIGSSTIRRILNGWGYRPHRSAVTPAERFTAPSAARSPTGCSSSVNGTYAGHSASTPGTTTGGVLIGRCGSGHHAPTVLST